MKGFNFKLPDESSYRYTKDHPYVGKGSNREVKLGVEYTGFEADVAEFNDLYMKDVHSTNGVQKMGLGIDEVVNATINFSRKNYADFFPENPYPKDVKLVGNSIKSKKMPVYIEKFINIAVRLLLRGQGKEFIDQYYQYIEKIYNYQIPIRDIATKGKVKKSVEQYIKDVKEITKAGRPKSRQAWYELAIQNNMKVDNGDTIYYVNTGKSKSHADVKKITHYYDYDSENNRIEITKLIDKEYKDYKKTATGKAMTKSEWLPTRYPNHFVEDEIVMNCELVPNSVIDAEEDIMCGDFVVNGKNIEYNCPKYIDMFNKRITPLLVCFSKEIRNDILVDNPDNRKYFTDEQCKLVSGEPNKAGDQDTYDQLMTMEDKEIKFWTKYNMVPPFLEECGMGKWEDIVSEYNSRIEEEEKNGIAAEKELFTKIIWDMSDNDITAFTNDGTVPSSILKFADLNPVTMEFESREHENAVIGNINDILEIGRLREMA